MSNLDRLHQLSQAIEEQEEVVRQAADNVKQAAEDAGLDPETGAQLPKDGKEN